MTDFKSSMPPDAPENPFDRLCWIMEKLLSPDGCPWDREQTHESLKQYLIEEAYEVYDAIESGDFEHLQEELGDVALQVVFHAQLARRDGRFDVADVLDGISAKLIRRHPHVFGETVAEDSKAVLQNWEQIKQREKAAKGQAEEERSLVDGVPRHLPALQKAHRLQEKTGRVGFDWPHARGAIEKAREEFEELLEEAEKSDGPDGDHERVFEEMGDLLFAIVNVARFMKIQPEEALQAANAKFSKRFRHIEKRAREEGRELREMTLDEMDAYWNEAKTL
ncbi:MAG: nucleoside triphosphate pyrophosphohydrolase [Candidatus Sumerlaeia bacterium]